MKTLVKVIWYFPFNIKQNTSLLLLELHVNIQVDKVSQECKN
jgi:hypothetical protein